MIWTVALVVEILVSVIIIARVMVLNSQAITYEYKYRFEPDVLSNMSFNFYYFPGWLFILILAIPPFMIFIMTPTNRTKIKSTASNLWNEGIQEWKKWLKE